jgi:hypothetical protein
MNTSGQLEQRIDDLVQGVLSAAREVALAAVAEAFVRNETHLLANGCRRDAHPESKKEQKRGRGAPMRRPWRKRSPDELVALGAKLSKAIISKPGETMAFYAKDVGSTPLELGVPVRRLIEEGSVRAIGERNQRKYYAGARA